MKRVCQKSTASRSTFRSVCLYFHLKEKILEDLRSPSNSLFPHFFRLRVDRKTWSSFAGRGDGKADDEGKSVEKNPSPLKGGKKIKRRAERKKIFF